MRDGIVRRHETILEAAVGGHDGRLYGDLRVGREEGRHDELLATAGGHRGAVSRCRRVARKRQPKRLKRLAVFEAARSYTTMWSGGDHTIERLASENVRRALALGVVEVERVAERVRGIRVAAPRDEIGVAGRHVSPLRALPPVDGAERARVVVVGLVVQYRDGVVVLRAAVLEVVARALLGEPLALPVSSNWLPSPNWWSWS